MKKAILVISFGTTYVETRKKTIEAIENAVQHKYPDFEVRRAFTSNIVRRRIEKNEGIHIPDVDEALQMLANEGFEEVYMSSLHIIPGHEYKKISHAAYRYQEKFRVIRLAKPLLYRKEDYLEVLEAVTEVGTLEEGEALFFMGHGSDHAANASYIMLRHFLERDERTKHVYVGTVEGYPELEDLIEEVANKGYRKIRLLPFMVVAGDHATNDMASDEEDSWKSILNEKGYETECVLKGLGEFSKFRDSFIHRLEDVLD